MSAIDQGRRPPFVWLRSQPVDPMGFIGAMSGNPPRQDPVNRWVLMRREIPVDRIPDTCPLDITVDGRYRLTVNGQFAGRGPVRSSPFEQKYSTHDIAAFLHKGVNVIGVLVHVYGVDTAWYEKVKGNWQPVFGDGGLWVRCEPLDLMSDEAWRGLECTAWDNATERMNKGLGFIESLDARDLPAGWDAPGFDADAWDRVRVLCSGGGGPESFFGGLTIEPFPLLEANPLPALNETDRGPAVHLWTRTVETRPDLPVHQAIYAEPMTSEDSGEGARLVEGTSAKLATGNRQGVSMLFGFGELVTGFPFIEIEAEGGEVIDIAVCEKLPGEFEESGIARDARIAPAPVLGHDAHVARYVAKPGRQRFERFEWSAVKWMQVTIRNADHGVTVHAIGAREILYPAGEAGAFQSSDKFLNDLWQTGARTAQLCMHDGWEDCPSREQRQWLGDVTVEHLVAQSAFGPHANALTAKYLRDAAASQRPDGLTQMFAPGDHGGNGLLIPDWTLQWILAAGDYHLHTGDSATIEAILPSIAKALQWFARQEGPNGLVADLPYWHFMDWSGVGRSGEACALNAQYAGTLKAAAVLADAARWPGQAERWRARASAISEALNTRHWDAERGIYVDCVDPHTGAQDLRVSQHANAGMILWADAPQDRWERIVARITEEERLTFTAAPPIKNEGEPLDLREGVVLANTFYAHFVYSALRKAKRLDAAIAMWRTRFGPMIAAGADTLWESYGPTASLCHGFSASPTHQMSAGMLGIEPTSPGYATFRCAPQLGDVAHASGIVPTVSGDIEVKVARSGTMLDVTLSFEGDMRAEIGDVQVGPGCHSVTLPG